ncbi:ABC-2 type transport system ATP-binding protein [Singulisphaera sp. GP187]|uniref:ABC transporter ATP-binding protein n=1 Tax=Singulisphaera sp. GP187 TaxID=1882752 RepID=UPI000925BE93|nr:ABC transporter ATP-binding protein [Singulisphaera sp. GP187]SIO62753.1 ABC-2 type transport system ATP-binding protein [Singulisphaera sp. GP187]
MTFSDDREPALRDTAIQTRRLTRYFGHRCAVDDVSFRVPRGSVFAFVGRNGGGKTTTIRMILGLLEPTRGSSTILGHDSAGLPPEVRARIGYMAEGHPVYGWMRVGQYAVFQRGFYHHWNQEIYAAVIDYFAINPRTRAAHLSHGQRAGLHLAMTLAIEPEVLMLDDPATGLDPAARRSLLEAMVYFTRDRERTIFFSTHLLDDVERVADYVAVMDYSVLRACCSVETFCERVRRLVARFPGDPPRELPPVPGLLRVTRAENELTLVVANLNGRTERDLEALGALSVDEQPIGLEDALIAYVGRSGEKTFLLNASRDAS